MSGDRDDAGSGSTKTLGILRRRSTRHVVGGNSAVRCTFYWRRRTLLTKYKYSLLLASQRPGAEVQAQLSQDPSKGSGTTVALSPGDHSSLWRIDARIQSFPW